MACAFANVSSTITIKQTLTAEHGWLSPPSQIFSNLRHNSSNPSQFLAAINDRESKILFSPQGTSTALQYAKKGDWLDFLQRHALLVKVASLLAASIATM
jgi:hypothetical protein